ncbi:MAG TPA: VOC family protein [Solirubrobacteraceae bacterium]|nr:VOC family protein [Solirubrobacteraceae bacterium]
MSRRDGYQHGVPSWIAGAHPEPGQAVTFYGELLGWQASDTDSPDPYFVCTLDDCDVAAIGAPLGADAGAAWRTNIWVESADETAARVLAEGGSVVSEPFDLPGIGRSAVLADPAGAVFGVFEPGERRGAQIVNEPGAWAMSALTTPDPEGAKAFYGAVFGWEADSFAMGDVEVMMWRLPGFVGGEPLQPVPRDLVATGFPGVEPGWSVDFWVHDIDATVKTAADLGGAVLDGPLDLPIGRQATLADPQGATFSVTRIAVP